MRLGRFVLFSAFPGPMGATLEARCQALERRVATLEDALATEKRRAVMGANDIVQLTEERAKLYLALRAHGERLDLLEAPKDVRTLHALARETAPRGDVASHPKRRKEKRR